jgi:hypothetical protein
LGLVLAGGYEGPLAGGPSAALRVASTVWNVAASTFPRTAADLARFHSRIQVAGPDDCWPADVLAIRGLLAAGQPKTAIAKEYDISRTEVLYIATGKHWSHVG